MGFLDDATRFFSGRPPVDPLKEPRPGELGRDGDAFEDFRLGGPDINPNLSGRAKFEVYNEMRMTDPAVRSILLMFKLPIAAAEWSVEPASDDPQDRLIAECVEQQFGLGEHDTGWLNVTWEQSLNMCLQYLDWGSVFEEIVWGQPFTWEPQPHGDEEDDAFPTAPVTIRPIVKLGIRAPETIEEIETAKDGSLAWLRQDLDGAKKIPGEKIVPYVHDREGNSWFGTSMLRAAYGPWRLKKALLLTAGIAFDRFAAGTPLVRYPEGGGDAAKRKADLIGSTYRTHERAWVSLPGLPPPAGEWDVSILSGNGSMADPVPLLRHMDEQIATAALQGFTRLGVTETGSRAVGEVLADPYYLAVQSVARYVKTQREKFLVERFVRVNFGDDAAMPKLLVSKIAADNTAQVVEAIANLSGTGWNMSDRDLQNLVRIRLGLSELPEGEPTRREGEGLTGGPDAAAFGGPEADNQEEEQPPEEEAPPLEEEE